MPLWPLSRAASQSFTGSAERGTPCAPPLLDSPPPARAAPPLRTIGVVDTGRASAPASRDRDHPQRSRRRLVWWVLLAVLFLLAVLAVVSAQQARAAQAHLRSAEDRVPQLRERLMAGDEAGLQETVK